MLENDAPVLVDFWAPWCGPCRVVAPVLEEIADERDDLRVVKLNVDENQQTAAQYQVLAIPTMILLPQRPGGQADPGRAAQEAHRGRARARAGVDPLASPGRFAAVIEDRWRIHLCGELRVELAGERREAQLRGRQGRLAFAYLVLHRDRPVRRDELVEALWAGRRARRRATTALAPGALAPAPRARPGRARGPRQLRLVLPEPRVGRRRGARRATARGRAASRERRRRPGGRRARRARPAARARGAVARRDAAHELDDLRVEALEALARGAPGGGAAGPSGRARRGRAAPFRESARAALIEVLSARGNVAEALRAYEEVRVLLREELGTAPGPGARRPARAAAARPAPRRRRPRREPRRRCVEPRRSSSASARSPPRLRPAARAGEGGRAGRSRARPGSARRGCWPSCATRAGDAAREVLDARAGVLEREFGFGVVRQLFEARRPRRERAAPAAAPRSVVRRGRGRRRRPRSPSLHGLFRLALNLAARAAARARASTTCSGATPPSLRFVAYLARRSTGLPVLVGATVRTGEPDADERCWARSASDPATVARAARGR